MYKLITFDMYSATLDITGSAVSLVKDILKSDDDFARSFFMTWRTQQWNYLLLNNSMDNGFVNYQTITETVLEYTKKKFNISTTKEQDEKLMNVWISFKSWPEANEILKEVKSRGYKIGMLSNGDQKMLAPLAKACDIEFDYIFSAEDAKKYKPHPDVYSAMLKNSGFEKHEVLHVAGSVFDVMGTKGAGFACAWSNRFSDFVLDLRYEPDYNMKNLSDLLGIL